MTEETLDRIQVLKFLCKILEKQASIIQILETRICSDCTPAEDWHDRREKVAAHLKSIVAMFAFSKKLPKDDLGIMAMSASEYLLKVQSSMMLVFGMIDMIRDDVFGEVYMESLKSITSKVYEEFIALGNMTGQCSTDPEAMSEQMEIVLRLEREIDEDNIIICRQITVATSREGDYICYMMRKIVRELEHISDYLKECAEIINEI